MNREEIRKVQNFPRRKQPQGRGWLAKPLKKRSARSPDLRGVFHLEGREFWLAGWNDGVDKLGQPLINFVATEKPDDWR